MQPFSIHCASIYVTWIFVAWSLYVAYIYQQIPPDLVAVRILTAELFRFLVFIVPLLAIFKSVMPIERLSALFPPNKTLALGLLKEILHTSLLGV